MGVVAQAFGLSSAAFPLAGSWIGRQAARAGTSSPVWDTGIAFGGLMFTFFDLFSYSFSGVNTKPLLICLVIYTRSFHTLQKTLLNLSLECLPCPVVV